MKYIVTIKQDLKYTESVTGKFDAFADAIGFIEMVLAHFENVEVCVWMARESER